MSDNKDQPKKNKPKRSFYGSIAHKVYKVVFLKKSTKSDARPGPSQDPFAKRVSSTPHIRTDSQVQAPTYVSLPANRQQYVQIASVPEPSPEAAVYGTRVPSGKSNGRGGGDATASMAGPAPSGPGPEGRGHAPPSEELASAPVYDKQRGEGDQDSFTSASEVQEQDGLVKSSSQDSREAATAADTAAETCVSSREADGKQPGGDVSASAEENAAPTGVGVVTVGNLSLKTISTTRREPGTPQGSPRQPPDQDPSNEGAGSSSPPEGALSRVATYLFRSREAEQDVPEATGSPTRWYYNPMKLSDSPLARTAYSYLMPSAVDRTDFRMSPRSPDPDDAGDQTPTLSLAMLGHVSRWVGKMLFSRRQREESMSSAPGDDPPEGPEAASSASQKDATEDGEPSQDPEEQPPSGSADGPQKAGKSDISQLASHMQGQRKLRFMMQAQESGAATSPLGPSSDSLLASPGSDALPEHLRENPIASSQPPSLPPTLRSNQGSAGEMETQSEALRRKKWLRENGSKP